ncbi:hypothetical protein ACGFX4_13640 [Kitasatospora sp. NPDC048365]|uniref:hypothetical protein n=1 Tax=Kitasatospora sp. NPDC048365 TaxID=3364050 RepID=UPI0037153C37
MILTKHAGRGLASCAAALAVAVLPAVPWTAPASAATAGGPTPAVLSSSGRFVDSFTLDPSRNTDPMYGLNVGLDAREQSGTAHPVSWTRTTGVWSGTTPPKPWTAQVGNPSYPNRLVFADRTSAVMLGAPALADPTTGTYTVSTTVDPVVGDTAGSDWASLVLSRSHRSTGYVTNADVDLALTVTSSGGLALFHGGPTPFWTGQVAAGSGSFAVSLTVSTGADRKVALKVNGTDFDATAPAGVTRWPSSAYLYLGAYLGTSTERTTFGDAQGGGLTVSNVDTSASASPKTFVDTYDNAPNGTPDSGLNDDLSARQPSLVTAHYSAVSGAPGLPTEPAAGSVQVNNPAHPNVLSFPHGPAAVRLDKPATADLSGTYTAQAVLTPAVGSRTAADWASMAVSGSARNTGWVEGADVALGLRIRANGALQLFQHGTATWATEQSVTPADSYRVSIAVAAGSARQATVTVNGTSFQVQTSSQLPRDGYLYLGSHTSGGNVGTVEDLRVSMLGGLDYFGYYDIMDPEQSIDHSSEVAAWTNMNEYGAQDPSKGFLDYCAPAACVIDTAPALSDKEEGLNPNGLARLQALHDSVGSNLDKVSVIYLIDEPYTNLTEWKDHPALSAQQVQQMVDWVRAVFPGKLVQLTLDQPSVYQPTAVIPTGVDLVGFDHYCQGRAVIRTELTQLESKLTSPGQHVVLFPESLVNGLWGCGAATDATLAAANAEYRAIAAADPRVVYLEGFRWLGPEHPTSLPLTVRAQQAIGTGVVNATKTPAADSVGIYRPGSGTAASVFAEANPDGSTIGSAAFGGAGDVPLVGHWSGPGVDTIGVYHPATQTFELSGDNATATVTAKFGAPGDIPLVGDWSGQGRTTVGVYRPSTQTFLLSNDNVTTAYTIGMGNPGDLPLVGDWGGNGRTTVGVYRPSTRGFYLSNSNTEARVDHSIVFGDAGDVPIKGDWDGTGTDSIGVYRPGTRGFYGAAKDSTTVAFSAVVGDQGDTPLTGNWG